MSKLTKYQFSKLYEMTSGISSTKEQAGHGAPFASFSVVFNNYFLPDRLDDKMNTSIKEQETFSIKKGDILITRTSETIDELAMSCIALKDYPCATYSGFVKRLRPLTKGVADDKYMAFYLRSKLFRKTMTNNASMTLRASFNEDIFSFLDLFLPDFNDQIKIGNLLYAIEKKIQLNNKINETLQEQASLLYDYWFVQFDFPNEKGKPYKSSGGKMAYNEVLKREIPEGWVCKTINESVSENTRGITPVYNANKNIPVINQKCIRDGNIAFNEAYWHDSSVGYSENLQLRFMDTLINSMGTGTLGRISPYVLSYKAVPHSCVSLLRYKANISLPCWLYCAVKKMEPIIKQRGVGSTGQTSLSNNELGSFNIVLPPYNKVQKFESVVEKSFSSIMNNNNENIELTAIRDWLLPMLMNGQATVTEVQKPIFQVIENGTKNEQPDRFALWLQNQGLAARGDIDRQTLRRF